MSNHLLYLRQALQPTHWQAANLRLITKILREFLYEEMIKTDITKDANGNYLHTLFITSSLYYQFIGKPRIFGTWQIDESSIKRWHENAADTSLSVNQLITDIYPIIGIKGLTLGHLLRELNNTLLADCHLASHQTLTADDLIALPNHDLEGHMQGHPWFVINKGRLGFDYAEYCQYAPEMRQEQSLAFIAVNKMHAAFHAVDQLNYTQLIEQELSSEDIKRFTAILTAKNLSADNYYFMPVHIWQWHNQLIFLFAEDIVKQAIVYLGTSQDKYLATQSVRTFSNISHPTKFQVKLPISIFNTAVYRGLPNERTQLAPLLTSWLKEKFKADIFFQHDCRLILLGEVASIDYTHPVYRHLPNIPYQYNELLGVIWRENVNTYLKPDEKAITMASLIHLDENQTPFISCLIAKSGLSIQAWLHAFFKATIPPLLHWLYQYGLVFSPHGENTLLVLDKNYFPKGLVIKDFIDDVNLSDRDIPETSDLPPALREVLLKVSDHQLTQFIHTGLFVVLYRYLSDILQTYLQYDEADFWQQVYETILTYQQSHPDLTARFAQFDLLRPSFKKMCLNRLRILSVGYADYDERPKVDTIDLMDNPANQMVINAWRKDKVMS